MNGQRKKAVCCAAAAGSMWGTIGLFVNLAGSYGIGSLQLTVVRMMIAAAALGVSLLLFQRKLLMIKALDIPWFGAAGILCLLLFNVSYGIAIEKSSMAAAAVLLYTSPVFVTMIAVPVFRERITVRKLAAVALAITGCAFVSGIMSGNVIFPADAFAWGILAAFGYAMYSITAGVCNIFSYLLYNTALKNMEPGSVAVIASVEPAVAAILGALVLGERIGFFGVAGICCILAAIVVLNGQTGRRGYERKTSGAYQDSCGPG